MSFVARPAFAAPVAHSEAPATPAPASPDAVEAARLFAEAQTLQESGRYEQACLKFEESAKKRPGIGVRFNLADCWERTGRTASAHALFLEVAAATKELGQTEREVFARDRAAALAPKLSQLQIQITGSTEGIEVLRDGIKLDPKSLGVPFPVDPGAHEIRINAPGKKSWSTKVSVPAEPAAITALVVPPLDDAEPVAGAVAETPSEPSQKTATETREEAPEPVAKPDTARSAASLVLVGVGVVGVAIGGAMGAQYVGSRSDAEKVCPSARNCTQAEVSLHDALVEDARNARTWTFVGLGVGGAALISAAYLHLTEPSSAENPERSSVSAAPLLSESVLGASLSGRF
jgi:hypothetical protein